MPPRRDLEQADLAARTMFNVFPQGVGERISGGARSLAGAAMGTIGRFTNPFGTLASDIGAARRAISGTPLFGRRSPSQVAATAPTPVLPSGTPMTGFDIYPTTPQSTTRTTMAMAPQPAAPSLASAPVPQFPATGMGIMGNENIRPLPTEQLSPMTGFAPTLSDRGGVNVNIAGIQPNPQIQTPYGTIYATPEQAANMNRPRTVAQQSSRSPAEQQALLAQMRQQGAQIRERIGGQQEAFFAQRGAEREALNIAERAARASGVRSMDILRARSAAAGPSTIGGIQREFASYQPAVGPMAPTSLYAASAESRFKSALPAEGSRPLPVGPMGPSGYALYEQQEAARRVAGLTGPYSNVRAEQRRQTRETAEALGLPAATNFQTQQAQEDYFRRRRNAV